MNAYELILSKIANGENPFIVAMLAVFFYLTSSGTLTQNNMTASNLALVMKELGYAYNTSTDILNDGSTDYTIYQLIHKINLDYYMVSENLNVGVMRLMIIICFNKNKINAAQRDTLLGEI